MPTVSIHRRSRFDYLPKSLPNRELQKSEVMNLPAPAGQTIEVSYELIRCLVWVVSELGHGCDSEFELTGAVVGGGSEVDEILESSSHPLG